MDRSGRKWMYERSEGRKLRKEFVNGVREFIEFAKEHTNFSDSLQIRCPCSKCKNLKYLDVETVKQHLYKKGFVNDYFEWVCHGEDFANLEPSNASINPYTNMVINALGPREGNVSHERLDDVEEEPNPESKKFFDMLRESEEPLYEGSRLSVLEMASRITNLKCEYNLPHRCVRRDYEMKGSNRLKDSVNKAAKVPLHKQISWMSNNIRAEFIRKRKDPDFIKRSDKAKKNRYSNQSVTSFDPGHRQGSISTIEVAERLAAEKNGVLPLAADVYEKTHGFEMPGGENILIGDRPNKTMAEYVQKLAAYSDKGVTKPPNEVFLEVVGGRKKGKVYGLGSASSMFYEVGGPSQTKQSTPHVSMVAQLSSQLEDSKTMVEECKKMVEESKKIAEDSKKVVEDSLKVAQANQEAHEKEKNEWKKEKEELVANMAKVKKVVADVFQLLLQERSFKPHDPRGPPTGGGAP